MVRVIGGSKRKDKPTDASALLLLLAYVEADCRRIGALEAAGHAALAAGCVEQVHGKPYSLAQLSEACH